MWNAITVTVVGPKISVTRLYFQYLAIFSNENLPKSIPIVPKWVENFAQNQMILILIAYHF